MTTKRKNPTKKTDPNAQIKMEITEELGLAEKIKKEGWGSLSSIESGRIGGLMARRIKNL
ncbi:small, acid-soluble spore protein, alpha/beta type [Desulfolucanica intricata]|uniref:small, acid-soluble spore protein, alpha/beta type n=1 Tax=Desulfolucanica intricata TaxID=1285191 RepID=UPI003F75BB30